MQTTTKMKHGERGRRLVALFLHQVSCRLLAGLNYQLLFWEMSLHSPSMATPQRAAEIEPTYQPAMGKGRDYQQSNHCGTYLNTLIQSRACGIMKGSVSSLKKKQKQKQKQTKKPKHYNSLTLETSTSTSKVTHRHLTLFFYSSNTHPLRPLGYEFTPGV